MSPFLLLSLIAGALAVDERAGWQSLLAQPVFAALIVGAVTGELQAAMAVGVVLELVWLSVLPMRGLRRPDQVAGAIVGSGTASLLIHLTADPRTALIAGAGVVVGLVAGEVGGKLGQPVYAFQNRYLGNVEFAVESERGGTVRRVLALQVGSLLFIFVVETCLVGLLLLVGYFSAEILTRHLGGTLIEGIDLWYVMLPALGVAALIHTYWHQHLKRVLILSAVMVILVLWLR
jgi:mannose/fructose/N-acetylgalactosamine-specific phosphotransferase system component IIC